MRHYIADRRSCPISIVVADSQSSERAHTIPPLYNALGSPTGIFTVMEGITVGSTVGETIAAVSSYRPDVGLDQYRWVQSSLAGFWVLEAGNAEFGFLCFDTKLTSQPSDDAEIVSITAGLDCTYDGE